MPNTVFAELLTGSHLYGTQTAESDVDIFRIVYPTALELVRNRVTTIAQYTDEHNQDIRTVLLGEFVMTLGTDIERSLSALHYPEHFGELTDHWLCWEFTDKLILAAKNMHDNAKNDKQRAHAYRLWLAYVRLMNGNGANGIYQMAEIYRNTYLAIRGGAPVNVDWNPTISLRGVRAGKINRQALADWVWDKYQQEVI